MNSLEYFFTQQYSFCAPHNILFYIPIGHTFGPRPVSKIDLCTQLAFNSLWPYCRLYIFTEVFSKSIIKGQEHQNNFLCRNFYIHRVLSVDLGIRGTFLLSLKVAQRLDMGRPGAMKKEKQVVRGKVAFQFSCLCPHGTTTMPRPLSTSSQ